MTARKISAPALLVLPLAALVLLLAATLAAPFQPRAAAAASAFPPITAKNLEGREFRMPAGFDGRLNVVVVAYKREQQALVDTWFPTLKAIEGATPDLRFYELPVISRTTGFFMSWMIDRGMRRGIPDKAKRERVITLYVDKAAFKSAMALPASEQTIHLLLVDKAGRILWRGAGAHTAEKSAALRQAIARNP